MPTKELRIRLNSLLLFERRLVECDVDGRLARKGKKVEEEKSPSPKFRVAIREFKGWISYIFEVV